MEGRPGSCESSGPAGDPAQRDLDARSRRRSSSCARPAADSSAAPGRLVYSTCSMNPIEDEAVVFAALEASPHLRLLPAHELLNGSVPAAYARCLQLGLSSWLVPAADFSASAPCWLEPGQLGALVSAPITPPKQSHNYQVENEFCGSVWLLRIKM